MCAEPTRSSFGVLLLGELVLEVAEPMLLGGGRSGLLPQLQDLLEGARTRVAVSARVRSVYCAVPAIGGWGAAVRAGLGTRRVGNALALVRGHVTRVCGAVTLARRLLAAVDVAEDPFPLVVDRFPAIGSLASEIRDLLAGVGQLLRAGLRLFGSGSLLHAE